MNRIDDARVRAIFNTMGAGTLALVDELYAADVRFVDPFHAIEGRGALRDYFDAGALLYEHVPVLGPAVRFLRGRV